MKFHVRKFKEISMKVENIFHFYLKKNIEFEKETLNTKTKVFNGLSVSDNSVPDIAKLRKY